MQPQTTAQPAQAGITDKRIKLVSHSMLFYWWPVWAVGLVLGCLSWASGSRLAIVPEGSRLRPAGETAKEQTFELTVPKDRAAALQEASRAEDAEAFSIPVDPDNSFGLLFCVVVMVVVLSTSIPLRGLWSVIALLAILLVAGVFAMLGWWQSIFTTFARLHVYLSAAGYLFPSAALLLAWVGTVFLFDQRRYVIFTAGQIVVHQEVGDMRQVYDTTNVQLEKRRNDLFRHVLLGFYSGDVVIQMPGVGGQQILLPNVLFADRKVQQVADLMKTRPIVSEA
jgi:hypothetical protein